MIGVDIVDVSRVAAAAKRSSGRFLTRLCTPDEQAWVAGDDTRLAAVFALKEAWIKAKAGRPPGFAWTDCVVDPEAGDVGGLPGTWSTIGGEVYALVGDTSQAVVEIVDVASADAEQLTARERDYCAGQVTRIAGRVAAKTAVARLLGVAEVDVEILPGEHRVDEPLPCRGSHPPVVLVEGLDDRARVSISHSVTRAIAVATPTPMRHPAE